MQDLIAIINWVGQILASLSAIIAENLVLRISVGLSIGAVILYTVLMVTSKKQ